MGKRIRGGLTYSNVLVTILALVVLGGGIADAASRLGSNSVGTRELKKNAVKTSNIARSAVRVGKLAKEAVKAGKLARNAVPTNRLRNDAATGDKVNESTLSTVPSAQTANSIAPPEAWHEVGAPGEPGFLYSWATVPGPFATAAFYKDQEGVVHLKGYLGGGTEPDVFLLPPGYRPGSGRLLLFPVACGGGPCTSSVGVAEVLGPGVEPGREGAVLLPVAKAVSLDGISFRAES